jgi:hypothetical protein
MSHKRKKPELDAEELEETNGEELPDREVMSTIPLGLTELPPILPTGEELDSER